MENIRFASLKIALSHTPKQVVFPETKASEYFGELTFNKSAMREYLTAEAFHQVMNSASPR